MDIINLIYRDVTIIYITLGIVLLAASSSIVGSFFMFEKKSLVGDAIAHSMLPGLCLGFLFIGNKNPIYLISGAFITGFISMILIDFISSNSKLKIETSTSICLSIFFGMGILLLSITQNSGTANQAGLQHFLFGKAASLLMNDVINICILSSFIILCVILFFKEFRLITFDKVFAKTIGFPVKVLTFILNFLIILSITIGVQSVGVVLMSAMLITPAAGARFWTNNLYKMIFIAANFAIFSGIFGAFVSYTINQMPTGPCIVVFMSILAFFSFLFSPYKGIIKVFWKRYTYKIRIEKENILKFFYEVGINNKDFNHIISFKNIKTNFSFISNNKLQRRLNTLVKSGFLYYLGSKRWKLTESGKHMGAYILKLHCLWEAYLTKYLNIKPCHVHEDAESIEHILTPELEQELISLVGKEFPDSEFYDKNR
ncbi:MAG: zinc ABC transporter permease [Bacteroidetes bacterium]|nr:zinc ABC transporter permease [Bacteroidota bacterium]